MKPTKLRCVDPTQTLTEGGVYTPRETIKKKGMSITHSVDLECATHYLLYNDNNKSIRVSSNRFEIINEQK